jgi:hypothetical protein
MAEIWYLNTGTDTVKGKTPNYQISFDECLEIFELTENCWRCKSGQIPELKTGNPIIDESGYVYVLVKVMSKELKRSSLKGWKAGWYISPLTVINAEKRLQMRQPTAPETE